MVIILLKFLRWFEELVMESEVSCPRNNQRARLEAGLSWADICWALYYSFICGIFHIYWAAYVLLGLHFIDGETDSETLSHSPKITHKKTTMIFLEVIQF